MQSLAPMDESGESSLQYELNRTLVSLVRAALVVCVLANLLFGVTDILFEPTHHIWIGALRFVLIGAVSALWLASHARWATRHAVAYALLALAVACVQTVGPSAMHGDLSTPAMLSLALVAAVSTAAPWGVSGQMAAVALTALITVMTMALATGDLHGVLNSYPTTAASVIFGMSLYGASVCRRSSILSIQRGIALLASRQALESREAQIREQLVQLDTLYRTAPIGLALVDRDLRYVRVNETLADMNGVAAAAHLGRTPRDIVPDLADVVEPVCRDVLTSGEPILNHEISGTTAKHPGATRHWRSGFWPVQNEQGQTVAVSCVVQDITDQRQAHDAVAQLTADLERRVLDRTAQLEAANTLLEQEATQRQQAGDALRRSQKQLRDILDNTTAVIYLKDTQGRYILINRQFENLFHVSREAFVGKTDLDVFQRETAEAFRRNDSQVLSADHPLSFEESAPHDDGPHTYVSEKFPLRDEQGAPYAVCGISTDITPRKTMEAQLHLSQAQLSALIENTGDAIWSIDRDYRLLVINSVATEWFKEAFGSPLQREAPLGMRAPKVEMDVWLPLYEQVLGGRRLVLERQYPNGGELHWFLFSLTPIITGGTITGATVFAKDITDLKRAEDRVREHQATLSHMLRLHTIGEMAAGLAHEINQPLAAISNYARGCRNRLASGDTPPGDLLPVLEEIATQALRAGEIIRRLRYMVEKRDPTRETVDLNEVVSEAVRVIEAQLRQHGVDLRLDLAADLPGVALDRIQIAQVIVNLLLNALEAMPVDRRKRRITVRTTRPSETTVDITVEDSGVGLAPAIREQMFEPFFTIKPSGLGMGLTISRSIVDAHGGRIWATNNADGGAQVHVVLPSSTAQELGLDAVGARI